MKKIFLALVLSIVLMGANAARVDSLTYIMSLNKTQLDSLLNANGVPPAFVNTVYGIDVYKVRYNTVSIDSSPIYASGLLAFPNNADCKFPLASFGHGTVSKKEGVPSRANGLESVIGMIMGSLGYVAALPD